MDLHGKTALVTGSAMGFGRLIAEGLAARGCGVIGCDLTAAMQAETKAAVEAAGQRYTALAADLADPAEAHGAGREAASRGIDVLVNNAGVAPSGPYLSQGWAVWERALAIDLLAPMAIAHEVLSSLRGRPEAAIVNIASIAGVTASPGTAAYSAAKHGLVGFSRSLELECEGSSVRVHTICPTMARTRMIDGVQGSGMVPVIPPQAVADAVLSALASGRSGTVFVPRRMRWTMEVLPRLAPGLAKRMTLGDASAKSWIEAAKGLPQAKD